MKKINYTAMFMKAEAQRADLDRQITEAQARIATANRELEQLARTRQDREQALRPVQAQLAAAQQVVNEATAYHNVATGPAAHAAASTLVERQNALAEIEQRQARMLAAHQEAKKSDADREIALRRVIHENEQQIRDLEPKLNAAAATKEQIRREWGEALYGELHASLTDVEQREAAATSELLALQMEVAQAKAAALDQLAQWPELKRRLLSEHAAREDATTKALSAALGLLDILLIERTMVEQAPAGLPMGYQSILSELMLDTALTNALQREDYNGLQHQRDRLAGLLQAYRRNLAA